MLEPIDYAYSELLFPFNKEGKDFLFAGKLIHAILTYEDSEFVQY